MAVNSATSALHIACLALDVGPGDIVWTSPISFVASANCALYCGATIDFVDIDRVTGNLSILALTEKLALAEREGQLPKVVIPVHLAGQSCDMKAIAKLSDQYGFKIIEDASHAIGAQYRDQKVGSCEYSDLTVFSFHPVKIITSAEGGMVMTNQDHIYEKLHLFRSHGITRDPQLMTNDPHGAWYYEQIALGFNYRMNDLQAALGLTQLERLEEFIDKRRKICERYDESLKSLPLTLPIQSEYNQSAHHLYIIRLDSNNSPITHKALFDALRGHDIAVNIHYIPIVIQPYFQQLGFDLSDYPESERYYKEAISIPIFPLLTEIDQDKVIHTLRNILTT